jgi:RNA polymerase sigma-70 factor (ECF subfamily)
MEQPAERFQRLIEPVHDRVLAFARCLSRSRSDGDDLFQEALLRALTKLDALRDDGAFRAWLYRVVISVHRNRCRRSFWHRFIPFTDATEVDDPDRAAASGDYRTSAWSPDAGDATQRARAALAILPAVQREAIVLFEIEGWQVDEVASLQGVSASAVKSRLARGLARLRKHYEKQLGTGVPTLVPGETP